MSEKSEPYRCERCLGEGTYNGSLRFSGDPPPTCKGHGKEPHQWVVMEPVKEKK